MTHVLAVDIGSHAVKLVAARRRAGGVQIDAIASATLPLDALHGHVVRRPAAVGAAIRGVLRRVDRRGRRVLTAVPAPAVMMRRLQVRVTPGESLDGALLRTLAPLVPGALDQTVLDYQRLGGVLDGGEVPVLAVVARRDLVRSYTAALRAAGLEPGLVDVDVFALDRLRLAAGALTWPGRPVLLAHLDTRYAVLAVAGGSDVPPVVVEVSAPPDGDSASLAQAIAGALELAGIAPIPARALLSGARAEASGAAEAIVARLGCVARVLDPFAHVALGERVRHAARGDGDGSAAFAVAVGLALRGTEAAP